MADNSSAGGSGGMVDPTIFEHLQAKIDEEAKVRESFAIVLCGWLGGFSNISASEEQSSTGRLLTIEEVGKVMQVPVNLKDRDAFHLTIEEYLYSLISLVDELARLAVNSVTLGDYSRPLQISQFVKDLHAGFQVLNLKNGDLRRRGDGIKYSIKKIEDVVYDLSLRHLIPKTET
ncbi:MAG: hypothetical protein M4579_002412 [Chaenotheca gracillima]|nr:MAG: hypothetical protein M4579_002412 [Chaenotheca gracillima]